MGPHDCVGAPAALTNPGDGDLGGGDILHLQVGDAGGDTRMNKKHQEEKKTAVTATHICCSDTQYQHILGYQPIITLYLFITLQRNFSFTSDFDPLDSF